MRVVKDNEIGGIEVKKSRTNETFSREKRIKERY